MTEFSVGCRFYDSGVVIEIIGSAYTTPFSDSSSSQDIPAAELAIEWLSAELLWYHRHLLGGVSYRETTADGDRTRLATIIGRYALGDLTLGQAAEQAEVSRPEMRRILSENGVTLRLGPQNDEEADSEVRTALDI